MKFFPSRTTFISFGSLTIQWYAVLIMTGALLAYLFAKRNAKEYRNIDEKDFLDDFTICMLWGGIIVARLWYCIFDANYNYFEHPSEIIRIWDGGIAIHGGLLGGLLVAIYFCKKRNISIYKLADIVLPTVLLAQGIGRWGNFVNQECFGQTVSESYYDGILSFIKSSMYIDGAYREPMFLYESIGCILGFILINFILRKYQNKRGDLGYAYLMWYGIIRFFIEDRRTDSLMISALNLKTAQVVSIVYIIVGLAGFIGLFDKLAKKKKPTLLFDLDGTLQDSEKIIQMTYGELFKKYDNIENFTDEKKAEILGPGLLEMFPKYFPNQDPKVLFVEYRQIFKGLMADNLKPLPGAIELLKSLKEEGYTIGIVTTRNKESTGECLELTGIGQYVDDYVAMDDVKNLKPNAEAYSLIMNRNRWNKDDIVVVGDSVADIEGGKNYGAYTIAYLFNPAKKEKVLASNPNASCDDLLKIKEILKENHYFTYNLR